GVDKGLFECQLDAEDLALLEEVGAQLLFDELLHASCMAGVARNGDLKGTVLGWFAHGHVSQSLRRSTKSAEDFPRGGAAFSERLQGGLLVFLNIEQLVELGDFKHFIDL